MATTTTSPERATVGYALAQNEGEAFWLLGMLQTIKISRDDTAGAYGLLEIVVPEGIGSPSSFASAYPTCARSSEMAAMSHSPQLVDMIRNSP